MAMLLRSDHGYLPYLVYLDLDLCTCTSCLSSFVLLPRTRLASFPASTSEATTVGTSYLPTTTPAPTSALHSFLAILHTPTHTHNHHDLPKMYAATRTPTSSLAPHLFVHSSDACLSHRIPTTRSTTTHPRRPPSTDLADTVLNHTFFFFAAAAENEKDSCCCEECSFFSFQCPCGHGAQRVEFFEESTRSCGIGGS